MFLFGLSSFSVEMFSGSPSGSEEADPELVTDNEVSRAALDSGSTSRLSVIVRFKSIDL